VPEFPNLRSLRLDFREQHFPATSFPHLFSLAPSLLSLEIDSSDRRIFFTHFAASIHLFSSLARLKAMAHHSQGCRALSSAMQNFPSNLLSLSFLPSSISDILRMPCTGLTQLQFGDDNFTSWPSSEDIAAVAQRLPYLQSLHMDLQVTDGKPFPVMQLSLFKQLTSLHMNYDDTDTSPLRSLSLLTGLRELNLNMSNLSMVDSLRFLSTLTQLVSLDLSETFFMSETDDLSWVRD
jgi:Leucine-rich repeat (LRR) protein